MRTPFQEKLEDSIPGLDNGKHSKIVWEVHVFSIHQTRGSPRIPAESPPRIPIQDATKPHAHKLPCTFSARFHRSFFQHVRLPIFQPPNHQVPGGRPWRGTWPGRRLLRRAKSGKQKKLLQRAAPRPPPIGGPRWQTHGMSSWVESLLLLFPFLWLHRNGGWFRILTVADSLSMPCNKVKFSPWNSTP